MKNLLLIIGTFMLFSIAANAQSVAGKYSDGNTTWEFAKTNVEHEFTYVGSNKGVQNSVGHAFYSEKQSRLVLIFKRTDYKDSIGYAIVKFDGDGKTIQVKTLNPDGSYRWDGKLTKK